MRRATIRTRCDDADATTLARALRPDNTDEMQTTVTEAGTLETRIERETTGGLHATVDDYVVNLEVATAVVAAVDATRDEQPERPADAGTASDQPDDTTDNE
ncbi:KEOPS complex subunit Pcc1 [Natrarchaeobaculum aegyptiacum]|uniref:KEOPS complex Pcc1-like subunit n=1 Tax=Natrarchaeobaculum aegyptiacum TaxID=745377 RepID=A0A2Z2HY79_9EURY|nr:KEOPS complex subunit Pcc1 [Natrarchaeobaculum aegyptiacum]ARS91285.1 KEOPS complex Pcc1-like subunit [Natrarchaeobaculum aegyptiacum]